MHRNGSISTSGVKSGISIFSAATISCDRIVILESLHIFGHIFTAHALILAIYELLVQILMASCDVSSYFYPHDAMPERGLAVIVCLLLTDIVPKQLNLGSCK